MSASSTPAKVYKEMTLDFLTVVLLVLTPSTVSWDKQALPATQSKGRVKERKGSEPHSPRQWVGGERGEGVE